MDTAKHVKEFIRQPYAWPGGYPLYAICDDGGALCKTCCLDEFRNIVDSIHTECSDGWRVEAITINYEDGNLRCDHCSNHIESAYSEPDASDRCDQCAELMINGVRCHETGCANQISSGYWVAD